MPNATLLAMSKKQLRLEAERLKVPHDEIERWRDNEMSMADFIKLVASKTQPSEPDKPRPSSAGVSTLFAAMALMGGDDEDEDEDDFAVEQSEPRSEPTTLRTHRSTFPHI